LLDQQFFNNPRFREYLESHYVLLHLDAAEEEGEVWFDRHDINSTPTVLLMREDGREIDRVLGYDGSPEEFRDSLESLRQGKDTLLAVLEAHERDPDDLVLAAELAKKYWQRWAFTRMRTYGEIVLRRPEEARQAMIALDDRGGQASGFEFASYTLIYEDVERVLDFLTEFPETKLREAAFEKLSSYLARADDAERTLAVYDALMARYPGAPGLLVPLMRHYERISSPQEGIVHAENLLQNHPESFDPSLRRTYASMLIMNGDKQKALHIYGPSLAKKMLLEDDYSPLNDYAWFWATRDLNLGSALEAAERALELRNAANIWDTLSMVHRKMGRLEEALSAEQQAVKLSEGEIPRYKERLEEIRIEMTGRSK
jgi:tetratricopeptide (TPR) repeat protein